MPCVFLLFAPSLVGFFTDRPETHRYGVAALKILAAGYMFYAWGMVLMQAFNGAGDTMTPTRINFVSFWMLQLPAAWALSRWCGGGPVGVFWSVPIAETLLATLSVIAFRSGRWRDTKIAADSGES